MRSRARVVVIGGGVVGASVLYHLALAGWSDVMLLERKRLMNSRRQVRQQPKGFLLRYDRRYGVKTSRCWAHDHWLSRQSFEAVAAQTAFTECWQAVKSADERVERLTKVLQGSIADWRFGSVVNALQALRGVAATTAIGLVAEIGDLN